MADLEKLNRWADKLLDTGKRNNLISFRDTKSSSAEVVYEWFFSMDRPEPFFIKNLETVQGDERDTIIFSVAYAKDSEGRFIHNFGPLNREGGERRLNVAVTRAKDNVQLVASIQYTDINLNNTGSEGVRLLRAYLDYAQNGEQALVRSLNVPSADHYDSAFEMEVCEFLRQNGFVVDMQIGCSGYRIDMGLRKPDSSDYLLAIECDGATYHSSKNARDRDSLRQRVLENMGWKFYRIWSTDWYRNKAVEQEKLLQIAREAIDRSGSEHSHSEQDIQGPSESVVDPREMETKYTTEEITPKKEFAEYKLLDPFPIIYNHRGRLKNAVKEILMTEAPLSEEFLLKRIVSIFDRDKVTKVVLQDFDRRMIGCEQIGIIRKKGFMYLTGMNRFNLRIPGDKREIKYISDEELMSGMCELLKLNVTATREGLYKTMTNLLGFSRTGPAIVARFDGLMNALIRSHFVKEEDGILSLKM